MTDMLKSCQVAVTLFRPKKGSHPWLGKGHHNYGHLIHDVTLSAGHFCLEEMEQLASGMSPEHVRMAPVMRILSWCTVSMVLWLSSDNKNYLPSPSNTKDALSRHKSIWNEKRALPNGMLLWYLAPWNLVMEIASRPLHSPAL